MRVELEFIRRVAVIMYLFGPTGQPRLKYSVGMIERCYHKEA